jgi:Kef-type K+ transport system membrane component KefB
MADNEKPSIELLIITMISFVVYLVCASLGVAVSFQSDIKYKNTRSEKAIQGTFTSLLGVGIMLPILYFMYYYTKTSQNQQENNTQTKQRLFSVVCVCYIFLILTASLGIWISNCQMSQPGQNDLNAFDITFIVILAVAILLPIFYCIFYFRTSLCKQFRFTT